MMNRLKLICTCILIWLTLFQGVSIAQDCYSALKEFEQLGYLLIKMDSGEAFAAIEPIVWSQATYAIKLGISNCIFKTYGASKVYIVEMGKNDNLMAVYDGNNFKVY